MKRDTLALLCLLPVACCLARAQSPASGLRAIDPRSFVRIQLPADGPLELVRVDYGDSRVTRSEREMHFDLSLTLTLRNRSSKPVEGLALALGYGFGVPEAGGLNAASGIRLLPGESFELPARMRGDVEVPPAGSLARPVDLPTSARLGLDTVLFRDGSAYGPNRLGMLAPLRINQAEAARDRRHLEALAAGGGPASVARALERWAAVWEQQPETSPRTLTGPRAELLRSHALPGRVEIVHVPGAPLEIVSAQASYSEGRVVDPRVEVRNSGNRAVNDFQVVWVFRDASGMEFRGRTAGRGLARRGLPLAPSSASALALLAPGERTAVSESLVFEAERLNRGLEIVSGRVFLRAAEFVDGQVWVPERAVLDSLRLGVFLPPSSETTRLWHAYRQRGVQALAGELSR